MNLPKGVSIVFIGVIPAKKNLAGKPFRTDIGGMYHTEFESAKYQCQINGGQNRYFFIEERYYLSDKPPGQKLGNIRRIHHFNRDFGIDNPAPDKLIMRKQLPLSSGVHDKKASKRRKK